MTIPYLIPALSMRDETGITPLYFRSKREFGKPHPFTVIWSTPKRPRRGVPLEHSFWPGSLRADQRLEAE